MRFLTMIKMELVCVDRRATRGPAMRMPSVAPNVRPKPGSAIASGLAITSAAATTHSSFSGGLR